MRAVLVLCALTLLRCGAVPGVPDAGIAPPDGGSPDDDGDDAGSMAPVLVDGGALFSVWAPHSDAVMLRGDFGQVAMTRGAGNVWSAMAPGAAGGMRYHFDVSFDGGVFRRTDPRARQVDPVTKDGVLYDGAAYAWQSPPFTPPARSEQIVYELHVGTFNVGDGGYPATYRSVGEKLDYLAALGVNMIELLPISEFTSTTSWGYNPSELFAVESSYGTPDDFKALVDAAHARGIGVIIDVVHNHYSDGPYLRCWDGDCLGAKGIYFYTDNRENTDWGPRPDFGRPQIRDYVADNAVMWISEYRCDGLRWDSTSNIRAAANGSIQIPDGFHLLQRANDAVHALEPGAIEIAEDWANDPNMSRPSNNGGAGFDSQWDPFVHDINGAVRAASDGQRSMATVKNALLRMYNGHASERVVFTESHDEVANGQQRIPAMIDPMDPGSLKARKLSTLGASMVFTAPGVPMLFMGQEMLMDGWFSDTRPLDWSKAAQYPGIVQLYTDLAHLRRSAPGLSGDGIAVHHVNEPAKVIAWRRWKNGGDDVVVIANFSAKVFDQYDIGFPSGGTWHVAFNGDDARYSADFGGAVTPDVTVAAGAYDGLAYRGKIMPLPAYTMLVLTQ
jgi:1,4-alpha-glucan branching enzyme